MFRARYHLSGRLSYVTYSTPSLRAAYPASLAAVVTSRFGDVETHYSGCRKQVVLPPFAFRLQWDPGASLRQ